ncbi:hypothetical protein [Lentibacillus sp. CBA3610]|uniref:hypothetical protein n=1 Tax=Lentibacillus sp. CBA3610 TaxID=2518176 RepID=UPI0015962932|nr:hypothetical protein [Lentibacillus sp. CBA3610]QKY70859.1 hypothetical protein Len3610_15865 [Lentibacillus sp. CBA3610]
MIIIVAVRIVMSDGAKDCLVTLLFISDNLQWYEPGPLYFFQTVNGRVLHALVVPSHRHERLATRPEAMHLINECIMIFIKKYRDDAKALLS